jgi:S-adenosylmethionine decarboxylase
VNSVSTAAGTHLLADCHGVAVELLRDAKTLERLLRDAARHAGAHVLSSHFHTFGDRDGVTGVVLLSESHVSIHTWPETAFAAIDVFMCGSAEPKRAIAELTRVLAPQHLEVREVTRPSAYLKFGQPD